ncbi:ribonuclease H-like domain-containing protein [Tanacetum coccineum]
MITYLKHVGNFKHANLKSRKFEDIQALYEKIKRFNEHFISTGSAKDEKFLKRMNEKRVDLSKREEIKEETKEEVKDEDSTRKRKLGTRKKMKSRKRRYIQHTSEDDTDKENEELRLCLTIAQDEDKEVDYERRSIKKEILVQMLNLKLESEEESTMALELIRFIKKAKELASPQANGLGWLVRDQTVLGKDYSNLLIADSLLKTIWFINAPCYYNEALASPNSNDEELSIPEQTATGKGTSNPLMAGSLPKTTKPTYLDCWRVTLISKLDVSNPLHLHPNDSSALTVISVKLKGTENYQVWSCAMLLALKEKNKTGFIDGFCKRSNTDEFDALVQLPRCTCHAVDDFKKHNQLMKLMQFLMGLDDSYMQIRSNILSREPFPGVRNACAINSSEESYRVVTSFGYGTSQRSQSSVLTLMWEIETMFRGPKPLVHL